MAAPKKKSLSVKKKLFRFYGFYNNISIGPKIHLNGVKIILHEVYAIDKEEALQLYKNHLIHNVGVADKDVEQYLIDLYYKSIKVEIIESDEHVFMTEIPLI